MAPTDLHPSELGYAFSYAKADGIIGWGAEPFAPDGPGTAADWFEDGARRLVAAGRLTGAPGAGMNFTDDFTGAVLALVSPGLVLLAQRRTGEGVRTQTVHVRGADLAGLVRQKDGQFDLSRYADLTSAVGASVAFAGASVAPSAGEAQLLMEPETTAELKRLIGGGLAGEAEELLVGEGAARADAASAVLALSSPAGAGVLSVLYVENERIADSDTFSVLTSARGETWVLFSPAGPEGPSILERSSAAALTARVAVGVAARLSAAR